MTNVIDGIVNQETATPEAEAPAEVSVVDTLVGEGKKYKDLTALADSRIKADEHISKLEGEAELMRAQLAEQEEALKTSKTIEDVTAAMSPKTLEEREDNQTTLNPEVMQEAIDAALNQRQTVAQEQSNYGLVSDSILAASQGDADVATANVKAKLVEIGVTPEAFSEMAKASPQAALKLIDINQLHKNITSPVAENANNPVIKPVETRNKAYYTNLRKTMGRKFYDMKVQKQFHDDFAKSTSEEWNS